METVFDFSMQDTVLARGIPLLQIMTVKLASDLDLLIPLQLQFSNGLNQFQQKITTCWFL